MTAVVESHQKAYDTDISVGMSSENRTLRAIRNRLIAGHFFIPISRQANVSYTFYNLVEKWKDGIAFTSSISKMCSHPAYLRIIGMGKKVLPFILRELEREPHHWFIALEAITGDNPISQEHIGNVREMTEDWLIWAKGVGYEW